MKLRLTRTASADLQRMYDELQEKSPLGRARFEARLTDVLEDICDYPMTGRETNKPGVRIKNTHPYPYILFYRVKKMEVVMIRLRHGARNPRSMPARPR